jgi:chromosome segregation ATPase
VFSQQTEGKNFFGGNPMDFEQLIKRLDWLDEERRKDKTAIATLQEQIKSLEGDLKAAQKKIKELQTQLDQVTTAPARLEQIEAALTRQRTDLVKQIEAIDASAKKALQEADKRYQEQFAALTATTAEVHRYKEPIAELKRELKTVAAEESRRNKAMAEWEARLQAILTLAENVERTIKVAEEARQKESRRLADLAGDLNAARKRLDEVREKHELFTDDLRRLEIRINELLTSETERRQAQIDFIETQSRIQVERDREWKLWQEDLQTSQKQIQSIENALQEWEIAQRAVKRAQEAYEEMVQKFERRINEISEMQRLAEDRFRQEWVTFKADNQKRWTSYTLTQDEARKDLQASVEKIRAQMAALEDQVQIQQDIFQQTQEANEQLLQVMLAQIHEVLSAYERILSAR